jgi:hypothetical protein
MAPKKLLVALMVAACSAALGSTCSPPPKIVFETEYYRDPVTLDLTLRVSKTTNQQTGESTFTSAECRGNCSTENPADADWVLTGGGASDGPFRAP